VSASLANGSLGALVSVSVELSHAELLLARLWSMTGMRPVSRWWR